MEMPLVDREFLIQRFPGKGGWTYVVIPEIAQDKKNPFGWVRVRGTIDAFELKQYKLMPMGAGKLFLPIRAEIRKKIGKQEGDHVHVCLYADHSELEIPVDIMECFKCAHPRLEERFRNLSEGERKGYLDWIASAKKSETRERRIATLLDRMEKGLKFYAAE